MTNPLATVAAYTLTSKQVNAMTGIQNVYVGWHFTMAEALKVLLAMIWLETQTEWGYSISANPDNPYLIRLSLTGPVGNVQLDANNPTVGVRTQVIVNDTDWFIFDQGVFHGMAEADVSANYDIADCVLPAAPPPPAPPPPAPAMGMPPQPQ